MYYLLLGVMLHLAVNFVEAVQFLTSTCNYVSSDVQDYLHPSLLEERF